MKAKRDCIYCQHRRVCFVYDGVQKAIIGNGITNIDGKGAPGKMEDIFIALATACTEWKPDADSN